MNRNILREAYEHIFVFPNTPPGYIIWGSDDRINWQVLAEVNSLDDIMQFGEHDLPYSKYARITSKCLMDGVRKAE